MKKTKSNNSTNAPLFTGDCMHDTTVSETEKAVEVSQILFEEVAEPLAHQAESKIGEMTKKVREVIGK